MKASMAVLLVLSATAIVLPGQSAAADPVVTAAPPAGIVAQSTDMGAVTQDPRILGRDGGASVGYNGTSLWAFGDTFTTVGDHFARNTLATTTDLNAADGISIAPPAGSEYQDAAGNPEQFTPWSNWENWFNYWNDPVRCGDPEVVGGDCGKQFFHWPGAFVNDAANNRLVVFFGIASTVGKTPEGCKDTDPETACPQWLDWGWSVAFRPYGQTAWQRPEVINTTSFDKWTLFFKDEFGYANPMVIGGQLYVNSCPQDWIIRRCRLAKVPVGQIMDRNAWRYYTGSDPSGNPQWSASQSAAVSIVDIGLLWSTMHYNTHLGRYVIISGQLGNTTYYNTAPTPWGPWSEMGLLFNQVPPAPPPAGCSEGLGNYAVQAHPEYGSGNTIYITYIRTKSWPAQGCGGLLMGTPEMRLHKIVFGNEAATTWASGGGLISGEQGFSQQTVRQILHTGIGGGSVRVSLTSASAVTVSRATVGISPSGAAIQGALQTLTFGGATSISIAAGQTVTSDPLTLTLPAGQRLAVSMHFASATGPPTGHGWSGNSLAYAGNGDLTANTTGTGFTELPSSSYFVSRVTVVPSAQAKSVVVIGDSLSDGTWFVGKGSRQDWPSRLRDRMVSGGLGHGAVVNMAIGGNAANPQALGRLTSDVLTQPGARTMFVLLGWNDILWYSHCCGRTTAQLLTDLQSIIDRGRNAGLRVVGATLPPFGGPLASAACSYPDGGGPSPVNAADESMRQAVNTAIRNGTLTFDSYTDFDAVLRNPGAPAHIQCQYAGNFFGWSSHPGPAGHQAMANAINLSTLLP